MNIPENTLIQDVSTRWNSTYFMYEQLIEQQWAIYAVIHDKQATPSDPRHLDLKSEQWDLLSQLVVVLKPLQVATTALSKENNISSSLIHPVVNGLVKCHVEVGGEHLAMVKQFEEVVTEELLQRFPFDPKSIAVLSSALDPRYHHLNFFSAKEKAQVHNIISDKVQTLYRQYSTTILLSSDSACTQPQAKKRKEEETAMSFLLGTEYDSHSTPTWRDEIEQFQKEPQAHHDSDAPEWWRNNEANFQL